MQHKNIEVPLVIIRRMKKLLVIVILFLGIAVLAVSLSELETIAYTLRRAHLTFFLLGIVIQLA